VEYLVTPPRRLRVEPIGRVGAEVEWLVTRTGLNKLVHGADVAVAQWRWSPSRRSSATHEPVVCEVALMPPPACMHGAALAPITGAQRGAGPFAPWSRSTAIRSRGDDAAHDPVMAWRTLDLAK
jgi:hypothetical protein